MCISADMAHAVHPNYVERHEPGHRPLPNAGPVLKVNASQRYATDALTGARFVAACEAADVPHQVFVSRNNVPCGSTIGPITATRMGIATVDVGCAQLSMHSARELCGADDPAMLAAALTAFYSA
jgi:aspartyl aminopeptidase